MNTGSALARFTITLSQAVTEPVQVDWFTSDGTAKAGVDYAANKGTVVFAPGETAKTVDILVYGRAVGTENRSFFVEMLPPTNAILGASIGECIITVDTSGSTPVTEIIVPTGPQGIQGKSAYQSYLDTTTDNPPMTEAEWVESLKGDPAEIAEEVAPLIDVGSTILTAEGTESLGKPDQTTVKAIARRVAYASAAKIATVVLADGTNTLSPTDLTGDTIDFSSAGFSPKVLRSGVMLEPQWALNNSYNLVISGAIAGDVLYAVEYGLTSKLSSIANIDSQYEKSYYKKKMSFEKGATLESERDAVVWLGSPNAAPDFYYWSGTFPKIIPAGSTPTSTAAPDGQWYRTGDATTRQYVDNAFKLKDFVPLFGATFASGTKLRYNNEALFDAASGLYWIWTGAFPKTVSAGDNPASDSNYYAVGRLNQYPVNDSRAWYDPSSTVDNTVTANRFFRTMGYLGLRPFWYGDILVSSKITIPGIEFDHRNLNIIISADSDTTVSGGSGKVLHIVDPDTVELTGQSFATSNIGQLGTIQLSGASFRNCTVGIEGEGESNRAYLRGTFGSYTQAADLYVMDAGGTGYHGDTPALFKYTGTAKLTTRPIRPQIIIRGPKFTLPAPLSGGRSLRCCIEVERNNVTIKGGTMNAQTAGLLVEAYVSMHNVTDCSVVNVNMLNNNAQANYAVLAYCTNRLLVSNCRSLSGWALVDGNFMRNTVVTDSYGATIGCHAMAWNFTVERCTLGATLVGGNYQGGVSLTGGGELVVRNNTYLYRGGPRNLDHMVSTRGDYGQAWEGQMTVEDNLIVMGEQPASGDAMAIVYINGADFGSQDLTRDCYLTKQLNIRRNTVKVMSAAWTADRVVINPVWFQTTFTQNVRYPTDYVFEDFRVETSGPGFTMDPRWPTLVSNANAVQSTVRCVMRRVQLPTVTSNMVFIGAGATTYRVNTDILIDECYGSLYAAVSLPSNNTFSVRRTRIGNLPIGNANSAAVVNIERCDIANGATVGGSTGADVVRFYENHAAGSVTVGSLAKYCHGNTVALGGSVTGRTVDEWYNYRDPSVFRTA